MHRELVQLTLIFGMLLYFVTLGIMLPSRAETAANIYKIIAPEAKVIATVADKK